MKMKHPKVSDIIKAYKSLKHPRLLPFISQMQNMHPQLIVIPTDDITLIPPSLTITIKTHKNDVQQAPYLHYAAFFL